MTTRFQLTDDSIFELLRDLCDAPGVSGQEDAIRDLVRVRLEPLVKDLRQDALGNLMGRKPGAAPHPPTLMIAAHMDEIGLMITKLEQGFLRFTTIGGVDVGTLPAQEVVVHGVEDLPGLVASRPPHVLSAEERRKPFAKEDLFIDVGLSPEVLADKVQVGDFVSIRQSTVRLGKKQATGKALDNRVSVAVLMLALELLQHQEHAWDVLPVITTQEEIGLRGATTAAYQLTPDAGIALDVTFARQPGADQDASVPMNAGPAIGLGPNLHPKLRERMVKAAQLHEIPYTDEVLPGHSGTDAWAMQVARAGIPTGLLSTPIRNMHTPVESVALPDILRTARLLAAVVSSLPPDPAALALDS